jgi:flagellar motor switch protein FliM
MSTVETPPGPAQAGVAAMAPAEELAVEEALREQEARAPSAINAAAARLLVELDVSAPVREFRVRDLLALEPGQIIETRWGHGQDVPLAAGRQTLAWAEFEVVETTMAVRVTHLA